MPPFKSVNLVEFGILLRDFPFRRQIESVHMHHTWRPNHAQYKGQSTIAGMWRTHTVDNGWSDITQHLTIGPDGSLWLCRNWNLAPASAGGHNGTAAAGPFMFEMVGDFDRGKDPFEGAQKDAALRVVAMVQDRFGLSASSLRFHNQMSGKTCPGSAIDYDETVVAVEMLRANAATLESVDDVPEVTGIIVSMLRDDDILSASVDL
jgi:N-acetylmuramoyl-L-alanine amidase